jgi:non-canonical purine NTP pyrophosphatase (RdgB/HAM1 family)
MQLPTQLVLATTNRHKVREIRALLADIPFELLTLDQLPPMAAPEEHGATFIENAELKARYYAQAVGLPVIAEDSGLEVDALDRLPGVESARFGGVESTYPEKFAKLYAMLDERGSRDSPARFVCAVALVSGDELVFSTRGTVEGRISPEPRGSNGFGYDPIFYYPPYGGTLGEQSDDRKRAVSHRGEAFRALRAFLLNQ